METESCTMEGYNVSHRPGFYAIDQKYMYVDDVLCDQVIPASIGTGNIMKPYLTLYKERSTKWAYGWANQFVNTKINIIGKASGYYLVSYGNGPFVNKMRKCYVKKMYVIARGDNYDTVLFSGENAYVESKYIGDYVLREDYQCKLKLIGGIQIDKVKKVM